MKKKINNSANFDQNVTDICETRKKIHTSPRQSGTVIKSCIGGNYTSKPSGYLTYNGD